MPVAVLALFSIRAVRKIDTMTNLSVDRVIGITTSQLGGSIFILPFADLIGASQELCVGYKIKEREGLQNPEFAYVVPFYAIPGAPSFVSKHFFNKELDDISGTRLLNIYMGHNATFGNHCVSDIYVKWGFEIVCLAFLVFGYVLGLVERKKENSIMVMCIFLILYSQAIYLPRSSLLDIIRPISLIVYVFLLLGGIKQFSLLNSKAY